ncbi:alpha/beta fold hydrolase [Nonomuraea recticatena]|uniref:alpha/beta fold hydrolase n=1 Tax=Nonomuraea recticatena TaxID=46178 RepID=UPI003613D59F
MTEPIEHWPGRMIGDVHVRSTPEGTAAEQAVFVHGLAGSATNWTDLMGELRDLVTGHAIDLPGAGYSPAPEDGDYSLSAHARAVIALMEHTGPAHLFGNSLGGAVAVSVAATRPDLVRSLTLISPALPDLLPRYGPARVAAAATPRLGEWVADRLRFLPPNSASTPRSPCATPTPPSSTPPGSAKRSRSCAGGTACRTRGGR